MNSTNMLPDYHLHSYFSADSETRPTAILNRAISLGMTDICFTDHNDYDYPGDMDFTLDVDKYLSELTSLKEQYSHKINMRIGLECGLEPDLSDRIHHLVCEHDFDFVIGSSHLVNKKDPYYPDFFEGRNVVDCFHEYFSSIVSNLRVCHDFDVYGHLDYIVRYPDSKDKFYSYRDFSDIIDEILRTLIHGGKGIEINAGGFRSGLSFPNPHPDILTRYRELGGEIITIGSDAHTPEYIGRYFDRIEDILKACGYKYYTIFDKRRPEFIKL